jgi:hypothetical protein
MNENDLIRYFSVEKQILIKNGIESISAGCFSECRSLSEVTFESGCKLKEIGKSAFKSCSIHSIRIPSNVEVIREYCFSWCPLHKVTLESDSKLKEISKGAFGSCPVAYVTLPEGFNMKDH